jgi:Lipocalin-like domain
MKLLSRRQCYRLTKGATALHSCQAPPSRRSTPGVFAITVSALATAQGGAVAQQNSIKQQVVGTWTYASVDTIRPDGTRVPTWGSNPVGLWIFGSDGRYIFLVGRAGVSSFASNSRTTGSPEENRAAVQGSVATFGRYAINEAEHTLTLDIEYSSYPNWNGTQQTRPFTITGDELKYMVSTASAGDGRVEVVLKRVKTLRTVTLCIRVSSPWFRYEKQHPDGVTIGADHDPLSRRENTRKSAY